MAPVCPFSMEMPMEASLCPALQGMKLVTGAENPLVPSQ